MPLKRLLGAILGTNRPKVIAVIGLTRAELEAAVAHARTGEANLPIWAWCAEDAAPVAGCERFVPRANAWRVRKDLRSAWPALSIVPWTGRRRAPALKLIAFTIPPFRVVIYNEAGGFVAGRPGPVAKHGWWRVRDAVRFGAQSLYSAIYTACQRTRDVVRLGYSLLLRAADRMWSISLAVLAVLARVTPPLARAAMRRMKHGSGSDSPAAPARGTAFIEIAIPGRAWPRRRVLREIRNTDATFVVFLRPGADQPDPDLIPLALRTNAFAVAPQSAYTGWRKLVIAKHPFRKLQPGETTRVSAPWSDRIVMRRDMLLEFGLPHAVTFGAALLILYWKAAARGRECLVVGQARRITQEPAMPLEDAEFVARVALSRGLRSLAPAHPCRARGNVAFSPRKAREFRGKPRVLVVSPYLPFPLSHGGAVRMYNLCRAMAGEIDFILACFREADEAVRYEQLHEVFREVYVVDADEKHADPTVPQQVAEYRNTAMADLVRRPCAERGVDLVQLEYTQMAEYRNHTGAVPVILIEHDLTFTLYRQLADTMPDPARQKQYELWLAFERKALAAADAVWTMSEHDRGIAIEQGASRGGTAVVPNGVDLDRYQPLPRQTSGRTILFVGSFRHLPNLLAFEALRSVVMPDVWRTCPDAKLHVIAGPHHKRAAANARKSGLLAPHPRIAIEDFVEDVRPAYRECDVVAIPLPVSAGTNIKLMEAMACGRPVVSTPVGCQGLDLKDEADLLIRDLGPAFAAAIGLLLEDENRRRQMGAQARATAEQRFGWDAIAGLALASYAAIATSAAPQPAGKV